jgi:Mn-dependent DtxR family transcriptional regulator
MPSVPDPSRILALGTGFMSSKVLLAAAKLDVFTVLSGRSVTGPELGAELGLHPRAVYDYFDALVALGILAREGNGPEALYRNGEEAALYLDQNSPSYVGGILVMSNDRLFRFWADLEEALRTGRPQNEIRHTGKAMFEELYADPARLEQFLRAMSGISRPNFHAFAERFDLSRFSTVVDVGGAAGDLSIALAMRHTHLRCVSFDLPIVEPIARRAIAAAGLAERVTTATGDFFRDPLPKGDLVTMGLILHDWNLEKKKALIAKAFEAVSPGGAFVVIENLIDDERRANAFGLLMSLNMLIEFGDAFDYSGADFSGWCLEAGFRRVEILPLGGPASAGVAWK